MEETRKYLTKGLETFKQKEGETFVFWTYDLNAQTVYFTLSGLILDVWYFIGANSPIYRELISLCP